MKSFIKHTSIAIMLIAIVTACTTSQPIGLPDGTVGQLIGCGGVQHAMADCYLKAGKICPKGYDIVQADGEAQPFSASHGSINGTTAAVQGSYSSYSGSIVNRSLIVKCH
jgi:hypothetical protein